MEGVKDKVIVVVGATGGMGTELCERLIAGGAKLAIAGRSQERVETLAAELRGKGGEVLSETVDVKDESQMQVLFRSAVEEYGRCDVLINLAGLSIPAKIETMTEAQFDESLDVNLKGTFFACKHFIRAVDPAAGGLIVNLGSMAAKRANGGAPVYCTAKAALQMFSQGLALQVKEKNIRVTTLHPGGTDTGFWGDRAVPREKMLKASDVVDVILFVLSVNPRVAVHEIAFESFEMLN